MRPCADGGSARIGAVECESHSPYVGLPSVASGASAGETGRSVVAQGMAVIKKNYERSVSRGSKTQAKVRWARPSGCICTAATSAPGLASPLPHLRRAHPAAHICTGTGDSPASTSAPGLGRGRICGRNTTCCTAAHRQVDRAISQFGLTTSYADLKDCDLVIEAVFEDMVHLLPRGTLGHSTVLDGTLRYLWGTHGYYMVHLLASAPLARVTLAGLRRTPCSARPSARDMHRSSIVHTSESCDAACHVWRICDVRRAIRSRVWLRCSRKRSSPSSTRTANPGAPATLPRTQHTQRTPLRARSITPRTCAACALHPREVCGA